MPDQHRRSAGALALLALLFAVPASVRAQLPAGRVTGQVLGNDGAMIQGANVYVLEARAQAPTDSTGHYELRLAPGRWTVRARAIGYRPASRVAVVTTDSTTHVDFDLSADAWNHPRRPPAPGELVESSVDSAADSAYARPGLAPLPGYVAFGIDLFNQIADRQPAGDHFLSPLSAALAIGMAYDAADRRTRTQIMRALRIPGTDTARFAERNRDLLASLDSQTSTTIAIANSIWIQRGWRIVPDWFARMRQFYRAEVDTLDLKAPESIERVNAWVRARTRERIDAILALFPPEESPAAVLVNAVYFKSQWLHVFDSTETRDRPFRLGTGRTVQRAAMSNRGSYAYARAPGVQIARLAYGGGRFAMYVLLPDSGRAVADLRHALSEAQLAEWRSQMSARDLHVALPKVRLEYSADLKPPLRALGMRDAFDYGDANFGRGFVLRGDANVVISRATQKTFVEVTERGTEAAAATGLDMIVITSAPPPPTEFVVDRPFLFIIRMSAAADCCSSARSPTRPSADRLSVEGRSGHASRLGCSLHNDWSAPCRPSRPIPSPVTGPFPTSPAATSCRQRWKSRQ